MEKSTKRILGLIVFIIVLITFVSIFSTKIQEQRAAKEEQEKLAARAELKQKRAETLQYNIEHKEEHYQTALQLLKEEKYLEAKEMLVKVLAVDKDNQDVKTQIRDIDKIVAKREREAAVVKTKGMLEEAKKLLLRTSTLEQAVDKSKEVLKLLPDSKEARAVLIEAEVKMLMWPKGNSEIEMSISIEKYSPLTLYVWIANKSNIARHTNPTFFTLVTVHESSLSVSSKTYSLSNAFKSVDLQPGTRTSGAIVFNTHVRPKKLIYKYMRGSVSRDFPFRMTDIWPIE